MNSRKDKNHNMQMPVNSFVKLMFIIKNSNVNDLFANKMALKQTNKQQKKTSTGKIKIVTTLAHTVYDVFFSWCMINMNYLV